MQYLTLIWDTLFMSVLGVGDRDITLLPCIVVLLVAPEPTETKESIKNHTIHNLKMLIVSEKVK